MKKSLSFLVALALVFGLFASMASAADTSLTTAQKYQQFVDNKILKGDPSGDARLGATLTRAEFVTIADAISGLDTTSATTQTFSDVKKGQWWYGAIEAAAKAGLVNGIGQGKFGPKLNVTVEQAIKVFVLAAGLKPVDGASVDGSSVWAGPFIKAAQDAGFPIPSNYKANATRGQAIDLAYAAYVAKSVPTLSDVKAVANDDDTIAVTGKVNGTVDKVTVALGSAAAVNATLKGDGTFSYTTAAQAAGTYSIAVVAYDGTKASATQTVSVTVDGFKVTSATVVNAKQIAVQFNKAVLEGTSTGGYKVPSSYGLSALGSTYANPSAFDLSSDKKTVTLTFKDGFPLDTYGQLDVKNVKSASGKTVDAFHQAIYLTDKTAPTVTGVSYSGGVAKVSFSEPLASEGTVSINGNKLPYGDITYSVDHNDPIYGSDITAIEIQGLDAGTNYTLTIIGGQDTAGKITNVVGNTFDYTTTLNVPSDSTAPTVVSVTPSGNGDLKVKFSEALSNQGSVYIKGATPDTISGSFTDDTKTEVLYPTHTWLGTDHFKTLTLKVTGFKDLVSNVGADYTTTVTLSADTTAPTVSSVFYANDGANHVVFSFNEAIGTSGTVYWKKTTSNKVVTSGTWNDGNIGYDVNDSVAGSAADESSEYSYVYFNHDLDAATYEFTLKGFKDVAGNTLSDTTVTLTVTGSGTSGIIQLSNVSEVSPGVVKFSFADSQAKIAASSLVPSNFLINGTALPTGTNLYFNDNAQLTVIAELPSGFITATGNRIFSVQNIVDESGNTLNADYTKSGAVALTENVKPVAGSISVASDKKITVSFNETLKTIAATTTSPGVEVYLNGSTTKATGLTYSVSGSTLTIEGNSDTFSTTTPIIVKFVSSSIADSNGNTVADGQVTK